MSRKYPDLINDLAIIQGETYVELTDGLIYVEGDWTDGEPRGQIRTDIFANGGALLAVFEFEDSVYDEENDKTVIKPFLRESVTASLPVTSWKDGKVLSSRNAFVYDIEIQLNLAVIKLAFGWVQVIGEVTAETQTPPVIIPRPTYLTADNNLSELENPEEAIANLGLDDVVRAGDIADFETSTQLDARDIENRKWVNFSGIPAWISNATEFGQSLVNAATAAAAKILLGLDNVDNTSDADKPISDATLTALQVLDGEISANTAARHDAVTTVDSDTIQFGLTDQEITGSVKDGSIDADKLSSGVNASLNKADSAVLLTGDQTIAGQKTFTSPVSVNGLLLSRGLTENNSIGLGFNNLLFNTAGGNVAIGDSALTNNTTGSTNVAIGRNVLTNNTTGIGNCGLGTFTLTNNTTGQQNMGIGRDSLFSNTTGSANVAIGNSALFRNIAGGNNIAIGNNALQNLNKVYNANELQAGTSYVIHTVGTTDFTLIGAANNNVGTTFTATGAGTGTGTARRSSVGVFNIAIGTQAGQNLESGAYSVYIAPQGRPSSPVVNYEVLIGGINNIGKGENTAFIVCSAGAYNSKNVSTWETTSDGRIKKNIVDNNQGLEVIESLRVRNFEYRSPGEITELPSHAAIDTPGVQLGVIAQELREVLPECVTENSTGVLSVNTDPLIWYLINAVKELSAEIKQLKGEN